MDIQLIIVGLVILGAGAYATGIFVRKGRSIVQPSKCVDDCGCSSKTETPKSAH